MRNHEVDEQTKNHNVSLANTGTQMIFHCSYLNMHKPWQHLKASSSPVADGIQSLKFRIFLFILYATLGKGSVFIICLVSSVLTKFAWKKKMLFFPEPVKVKKCICGLCDSSQFNRVSRGQMYTYQMADIPSIPCSFLVPGY